jgi:uncharacterized protein (TIGR02996 family)
MSDEAAFLTVLTANPADDTARLVYADWLDEHNEPQKAEYLRLVVDLVRTCADLSSEHGPVPRLLSLAEQQSADWRTAVGSRFGLLLYQFGDKVRAVKELRSLVGVGLGEAISAIKRMPLRIYDCVPLETAVRGRSAFVQDPRAALIIHPSDRVPSTVRVLFKITAYRHTDDVEPDPCAVGAIQESSLEFARFLASALSIPLAAANELAVNDQVTLADDLDPTEFETRWNALCALLPTDMPDSVGDSRYWVIRLDSHSRAILAHP